MYTPRGADPERVPQPRHGFRKITYYLRHPFVAYRLIGDTGLNVLRVHRDISYFLESWPASAVR